MFTILLCAKFYKLPKLILTEIFRYSGNLAEYSLAKNINHEIKKFNLYELFKACAKYDISLMKKLPKYEYSLIIKNQEFNTVPQYLDPDVIGFLLSQNACYNTDYLFDISNWYKFEHTKKQTTELILGDTRIKIYTPRFDLLLMFDDAVNIGKYLIYLKNDNRIDLILSEGYETALRRLRNHVFLSYAPRVSELLKQYKNVF